MGIASLKAPTIATACISGPTSKTTRSNPVRLALLKRITDEVSSRVVSLDALLLPGGFFRLSRPLGHLSFDKRVKELGNAGLVEPLRSLARKLDGPGRALIVFGVDGSDTGNGAGGDQFCIAVSRDGVEGIGRKVFPTTIEAHNLLCFDTTIGLLSASLSCKAAIELCSVRATTSSVLRKQWPAKESKPGTSSGSAP